MRNFFFRRRNYPYGRRRYTPDFSVSPEAKKSIIIVFLFSFGLVVFLSILGIAGSFGDSLLKILSYAVGKNLVFLIAALSWVTAFLTLFPERFSLNAANYLGVLLLLVSASGLAHLAIPENEALVAAKNGLGGGFIGYGVSYPALRVAGAILTMFGGILLIILSIILIFNTSLSRLAGIAHILTFVPLSYAIKNIASFMRMVFSKTANFLREARERRKSFQEETSEGAGSEETYSEDEETPSWETKELKGDYNETPAISGSKEKTQPSLIAARPRKRNGLIVPLDLLDEYKGKPTSGDVERQQEVIKESLASFGIPVEMGEVTIGPTITRFTLKPATGVKLAKISALHNDLALALAAHPIRIEAPIPGQSLVGIEVPNKKVAIVGLRDMFNSDEYLRSKSFMPLAVGRDVGGTSIYAGLDKMPHLLIAGATGSGKSVCINTVLLSLLYKHSPEILKLILVDPKRVELSLYNGIPHLITPVITEN